MNIVEEKTKDLAEQNKNTTQIMVTYEKTIRASKIFEATDEQIWMLQNYKNPFEEEMDKMVDETDPDFSHNNVDYEYNYAVENQDTGLMIVDWD